MINKEELKNYINDYHVDFIINTFYNNYDYDLIFNENDNVEALYYKKGEEIKNMKPLNEVIFDIMEMIISKNNNLKKEQLLNYYQEDFYVKEQMNYNDILNFIKNEN